MELGDASVKSEARERSEGSDGARDVPRGAVAPDEEEYRGRRRRRRAAHFVEQDARGVEAAVLGEDGEHGVARAPPRRVPGLRRGPPERGMSGGAAVAEARQRGHHERLGRLGAAPVEGPRGVRGLGAGGLGSCYDGVHPSGDIGRELLVVVVREGERVIFPADATVRDGVPGRNG
jgi:hypothetical protein